MRRVLSVPQAVAEETVTTSPSTSTQLNSNEDDMPVIQRYDSSTYPTSTSAASSTTSRPRIVYNQRTGQTNGKVLLIRRNDGTTQYLRPVITGKPDTTVKTLSSSAPTTSVNSVRRIVSSVGNRQGNLVKSVPTRVIRFGPGGQQIMTALPTGSRILRIPGNDASMTNRRPIQHHPLYEENLGNVARSTNIARSIPRLVTRGGTTMAMGQRIAQTDFRQSQIITGRTVRRGYADFIRVPSIPTRPYRFDFESNEDEERAIAEAIEKEEERMRMEEEENRRDQEKQWNHPRIIDKFGQIGSNMLQQLSKQPLHFSSNLMPSKDDTPDLKQIKQTLDSLITQVCRWDKQYGWFKAHQRRPKHRVEVDKLKTRRLFSNQRELMLAEHVERLRREINKRRTRLENEAEILCGLPTPWRKSKSKSSKSKSRSQAQDAKKNEVRPKAPIVNPAEISLGVGSINWIKKEIKDEDELVEDLSQPPMKKVKIEGRDDSPRRKPPTLSKSDRTLRTRINSHSSVEDISAKTEAEPPRKRGRPRKEQPTVQSDDSDGGYDYGIPEGMTNPNDPHCICRKKYNSRRFYLSCNVCSGWFHGKCVNITKEECANLTSFECPTCREEQKQGNEGEKLYCLCKKPYDDRLFYVGCDRCEDWFHPECVGITQKYAESIAEYLCPMCKEEIKAEATAGYESATSEASTSSNSPPLSRNDYPKVWRLLERIVEHRMSWPFREPIDPIKNPGYAKVIKKPMDLSTIQKKLERLEYIKLRDFKKDMLRIFENAKIFHPKENPAFLCATTLETIFEQNLEELKKEISSGGVDRRKPSESQSLQDIDTDQLIDPGNYDIPIDSNFDISRYI